MARTFNGTSDLMAADYNFSAVGIIPATQAVVVGAWLYRQDNAASKIILEFGNTNGTAGFDVQQNAFAGPADLIRSFWGVNSWADSYPSPATGGWHHHLWYIPSGGQYGGNTCYIDGTLQTLTNQGHTAGGPANYGGFTDKLSFGARLTSGVASLWANIRLAEIGLWTFTGPSLVATSVLTLVSGRPPHFAYDEGLPTYYPLLGDSPEANIGSGHQSMVLTGTTYSKHPPVDSMMMGVRGARVR